MNFYILFSVENDEFTFGFEIFSTLRYFEKF